MPSWSDALKLVIQAGVSSTYDAIREANAAAAEEAYKANGAKFDEAVKGSIADNVGKWADVSRNKVIETLQDEITNTLQQAYDEKISTQELSKTLDDLLEGRGEIVARTEVLKSIGFGKNEAYKANGVKWKQWVHKNRGPHAREEHQELDDAGPIPFDEPWQTSYGEVMFPGDPGADPGDLCNCGCTEVEANAPEGYEDEENE
jgi:hypothetical protein